MIGISQALNLLSDSPSQSKPLHHLNPKLKHEFKYPTKLDRLPYNFYFKPPDIITFQLRSTCDQLFNEAANDLIITDVIDQQSLICLDNKDQSGITTNNSSKKRKLRFDENSIVETSLYMAQRSMKKGLLLIITSK